MVVTGEVEVYRRVVELVDTDKGNSSNEGAGWGAYRCIDSATDPI
eukprot:COSAG05_NODE_1713_length_4230_cov_3.216897_4_plen_45_part_00